VKLIVTNRETVIVVLAPGVVQKADALAILNSVVVGAVYDRAFLLESTKDTRGSQTRPTENRELSLTYLIWKQKTTPTRNRSRVRSNFD